jgi:hypothetical protein
MRLAYNILWFENDNDFVDSAERIIRDFLRGMGFMLKIQPFSDGNCEEDVLRNPKWNLILMDYDLGDENGSKVIEHIRKLEVSTEVIFYSGQSNFLEEVIKKTPFEGVYWCGRGKDFDDKVKKVIGLTLKKLMDPTAMRGLVMAEVADLDQMVDEALKVHHDHQDEEKKAKFRGELLDIAVNGRGQQIQMIQRIEKNSCTLEECVSTRVIDASRKADVVNMITKPHKADPRITAHRESFVSGYTQDVLKVRNDLAHVKSEEIEGREVMLVGGEVFDEEKAIGIRKNLTKHAKNLDGIINGIALIYDERQK